MLFRHALRNAMIPIVTVAASSSASSWRAASCSSRSSTCPASAGSPSGAISARDLPVVQGVVLFVASMIVLINVAVDLLYGFLDPRIRYE